MWTFLLLVFQRKLSWIMPTKHNEDLGISFAAVATENDTRDRQPQEAQQVVLDNVYSCFNDRFDINTGIITPLLGPDAVRFNACVEATGQIFAGTTVGTAQVCPIDPSFGALTRFRGDISDVINFSLDEDGDGPITSCDDLFAQQEILFENDGTRAPTPVIPDPFITDEGEPCVSSRAENINSGCVLTQPIPIQSGTLTAGTISFGETIQGITSTFFETIDDGSQAPRSDTDDFKFFHRGGSLSATLKTSFGTGARLQVCQIRTVSAPAGCVDGRCILSDNVGAADNPARSFASLVMWMRVNMSCGSSLQLLTAPILIFLSNLVVAREHITLHLLRDPLISPPDLPQTHCN